MIRVCITVAILLLYVVVQWFVKSDDFSHRL